MITDLLMLIGGLALIVNGGGWFVAAAVRLAEFLRMPRVVIGSTLVSLATTTPEFVVSIMAGLRGEPGLAAGNAIGSAICNIGLILGITAAIKLVDVQWRSVRTPLIAMCALGGLLFALSWDLTLSRAEGVLLLALGGSYFAWDFWQHWRDRNPAHLTEAVAIEAETATTRWRWFETKTGSIVQFMLGSAVVVGGSRLLVEGAVGSAERLGIPAIVIGLTVVAVGTSLPELVTAITSSRKAVADLAVGNVLGANIANLSVIVGAAAVLHDVTLQPIEQRFNFPVRALPQGRHGDRHHVQPVEQILAERPLRDRVFKIAVRRGDDARVDADRLLAAYALKRLLLQDAQQLHLRVHAHVADLVEEERASVRLLKPADAARIGAGESAFLMTEKLAFQQRLRNGTTIHRDERLIGPRAVLIDRPGDQFLAGASLAADEHRHGLGSDASDFLVDFLHRAGAADQRVGSSRGFAEGNRLAHHPAARDRAPEQLDEILHFERLQ